MEKYYRVLSSVLLPLTTFLAFVIFPFALLSLANPSALIGVFIFVCVVIYMYKSVIFYRKNVRGQIPAKIRTRDWIYINGVVALFFVVEILASAYVILTKQNLVTEMVNKMMAAIPGASDNFTSVKVYNMLRDMMIGFSVYAILLGIHIFMSYRLVKKYRWLMTE